MKKILVIRLSAIGDVILTSAPLLNLKLSFPDSEIYLLTRGHIAGLAELFAGADHVFPFEGKASITDLFRMGEFLDSLDFDLLIDLHGNIRSHYLLRHISATRKIRYRKRRWERLKAVRLNKINPDPPHTIDLYNEAVMRAGGKIFSRRPLLELPCKSFDFLSFDTGRPTVAIAPGASYRTKQWPKERFVDLARKVHYDLQCNVVLLLTAADQDMATISSEFPRQYIRIFTDVSLNELAGIVSQSDLLICNDSAVSHLGSSAGTPVIALFGPTHPTLGFAPRGWNDTVIQVDEYCRPCSLHGKRPCFRDRQYCFERIETTHVLTAAARKLESNAKGHKALFIDRDGTLIKEKQFLFDPEEVEPEEGSIEAVKMARKLGYKIIVLSNQSGVARGYFDENAVRRVHQSILEIFNRENAFIDDIYYCPYLPDGRIPRYSRDDYCRKPAPGMIEQAVRKHNINPFRSFIAGDKLSDIDLSYVVGGKGILVRTGYGRESEKKLFRENRLPPEIIVHNLYEGVKYIKNTGI